MKNYIAIGIFILLILTLGFFIGQSCSNKEIIIKTDFDSTVARIDRKIDGIIAMQDSIVKQRILHQTFIKNENIKIDSLIRIDSAWVNAIIRARVLRLYQLPRFLQVTTDTGGIKYYPDSSTGW